MFSDASPSTQPVRASDNSDSSPPLDLDKAFAHPAGLRTARFLAKSLIRASQTPDAQAAQGIFSSVSLPFFDSSPEVASLLSEILAFSESENMVSGSVDPGTESFSPDGNRDVVAEAAAAALSSLAEESRTHLSFPNSPFAPHTTMASNNFYSAHRSTPTFTQLHAQEPSIHALPNMNFSSASRVSGSPLPGTESPYNVESPSGRSSSITPQAMSRQSSGRHTNVSSLPNPEREPLRLDQLSSFNPHFASSQSQGHMQHKSAFGAYFSQQRTVASVQQIQPHNNAPTGQQGRMQASVVPHIKNFLPVNKGPNSNGAVGNKDSLSSDRTMVVANRAAPTFLSHSTQPTPLLQQPHSNALICPHPGINHPSFRSTAENPALALDSEKKKKKKRKPKADGDAVAKRRKSDKLTSKAKREPKEKEEKPQPACQKISGDLWLRIIEFCPPAFLKKVRLLNKSFKELIDKYDSVYVNQRMENFGADIPVAATFGLNDRQYTDLLGGKGCLEPGCSDKKASRTHWSWAKRWCTDCWRDKIEREDRILKARQHDFPQRQVLTKLLECIPIGMHDSFMKAHDYIENLESRPSTAPRIYKYYLKAEVDKIIEEYQSLKPPPFKDDPTKTAAENASARADHQQLEAEAVTKQSEFLEARKEKNTEHMQRVLKIEGAIRMKRQGDALPYNENRKARKELFLKRASEDLPDIPESFVMNTKAFKAATRIFRDPGTERGWKTLQPKIQKAWEESASKRNVENAEADVIEIEEDDEIVCNDLQEESTRQDTVVHLQDIHSQSNQQMQMAGFGHQRIDQNQHRTFMSERANGMLGGMFGSLYGNSYSDSASNNAGSNISGFQSMYSNQSLANSLANSSYFNGSAHFQSQLPNLHPGSSHMSMNMDFGGNSYQGSYMQLPQVFSNNNNNYGSLPQHVQPSVSKITVNSLLAPAPAHGSGHSSGHNFDSF